MGYSTNRFASRNDHSQTKRLEITIPPTSNLDCTQIVVPTRSFARESEPSML
ncbi:hypothetical protein KFK09_003638 [Dendrobium nobile]|uniref:Uncharacterized protein n=1 Tax=Dendrobium nobile TaxID=94219 RepID=A0A8T3BY45_DENNO|nr:hypothetical protein KFK09_003638 [Dendrobium nobile]